MACFDSWLGKKWTLTKIYNGYIVVTTVSCRGSSLRLRGLRGAWPHVAACSYILYIVFVVKQK